MLYFPSKNDSKLLKQISENIIAYLYIYVVMPLKAQVAPI